MISSSPCSFSLDVQVVQGSVILPPPPPSLKEDYYEDHFQSSHGSDCTQWGLLCLGCFTWVGWMFCLKPHLAEKCWKWLNKWRHPPFSNLAGNLHFFACKNWAVFLLGTSWKDIWQKNQQGPFPKLSACPFLSSLSCFFSAFQLLLVLVSFCWFPLGKSWEQLGSLLATMTFLCKTSHIDHGFGGVAAMNVRKLVWCLYNGPCWTTGLHSFQLFVVNVVFARI